MTNFNVQIPTENYVQNLDGQGWIGLINVSGSEIQVVNAARVSFGKMKTKMDEADKKLLKYLLDNQHTSPLEHINFTFIVHCPLYVRSQWHRHRTWSFSEISRRYTSDEIAFYDPPNFRTQHKSNRQASTNELINPILDRNGFDFDGLKASEAVANAHVYLINLYQSLLDAGVCREQARGVLPQDMFTTFWATVDLNNLIKFLKLRDDNHAQKEIQEYAIAIKQLIKPYVPTICEIVFTG